jgi:hypothetical protein
VTDKEKAAFLKYRVRGPGGRFTGATMSYQEWFWHKVKLAPGDACWVWTGAKASLRGYGQSIKDGKACVASRVAYESAYGPIPVGMCVCHRCDNPPCCRPDHLFLGTREENIQDMIGKRRHAFGEKHPQARLSAAQVAEIKKRMHSTSRTVLAKEFGVSNSAIDLIKMGRHWKHVEAAK